MSGILKDRLRISAVKPDTELGQKSPAILLVNLLVGIPFERLLKKESDFLRQQSHVAPLLTNGII